MSWLRAVFKLYKRAFQGAFKNFIANPIFMIIGAVIFVVLFTVQLLTAGLPLFGYLIRALVQSASYSSYLYLVQRASLGYRVDWQDAKQGIYDYTRVIMGLIILNNFILIILVQYLKMPPQVLFTYLLVVTLLLNALPEVIVNRRYYVIDSIKYAIAFARQNWLIWYLPNLLFALLFVVVQGFITVSSYQLDAVISVKVAALTIVLLLVVQFLGGIVMLFRQILFRMLESGDFKRRFRTVK